MSPKTGNQAIAFARKNREFPPGFCLKYVRTAYGVGPLFPSAAEAWRNAQFKHLVGSGMQVPRGVPVYWTGGSQGFGHIAIAAGNGTCWSTDAGGSGIVAKVKIDDLTAKWGIDFKGWAEDVNNVRVFNAANAAKPNSVKPVRLKQLMPDPKDDVREVQKALKRKLPKVASDIPVDGYFGPRTQKAYAAWQRRCGFTGSAADGIPGKISLQRLGFAVK